MTVKRLDMHSLWPYCLVLSLILLFAALALIHGNSRVVFWGPKEVPQQVVFSESVAVSLGRVVLGASVTFVASLALAIFAFHAPPRRPTASLLFL